jgi:uncharacterized protein (TIGR03067 family)
MKTTTAFFLLAIMLILVGLSACSITHQSRFANLETVPAAPQNSPTPSSGKSDSDALQGTWKGEELGGKEGACYLIVSGKNFEFRGADPREWYKGTFTLREDVNPKQLLGNVVACADPRYNGKTTYAIYQIQDGTLKLTAHQPGNREVPPNFESSDARRFVFKGK